MSTALVNPDGTPAIKDASQQINFYPKSVADRVPFMIRNLVYMWIGLVVLGALLVSRPTQINEQENGGEPIITERKSLLTVHEEAVNLSSQHTSGTASHEYNQTENLSLLCEIEKLNRTGKF